MQDSPYKSNCSSTIKPAVTTAVFIPMKCNAQMQGLGLTSDNFNNKACQPVPTAQWHIYIYVWNWKP